MSRYLICNYYVRFHLNVQADFYHNSHLTLSPSAKGRLQGSKVSYHLCGRYLDVAVLDSTSFCLFAPLPRSTRNPPYSSSTSAFKNSVTSPRATLCTSDSIQSTVRPPAEEALDNDPINHPPIAVLTSKPREVLKTTNLLWYELHPSRPNRPCLPRISPRTCTLWFLRQRGLARIRQRDVLLYDCPPPAKHANSILTWASTTLQHRCNMSRPGGTAANTTLAVRLALEHNASISC